MVMTLLSANFSKFETSDLEAHREAVQPNQIQIDQLSPGAFASQVSSISAHGMMLYRERWNQRLHVRGANPAGYILIGVNTLPGIVWRGESLEPDQLILNHADAELEYSTGQSADHLVLLVPTDRLSLHVGEQLTDLMCSARTAWRGDPGAVASLAGTMRRLLDDFSVDDRSSGCEQEFAAVEHELLEAVAGVCVVANGQPARTEKIASRRALLRAIEYTSNLHRSIRLPDLVAEVGISQRSLEYAFKGAFGVSPVRYLRWSRLNHVRRELLSSAPGSTTVTQVATHWGFCEMSHLAVDYNHLFAESPSATLARTL